MFCVYIAFLAIAMLRVLTGLYVNKASQAAAHDREEGIWDSLRQQFEGIDFDGSGTISKEEFTNHLDSKEASDLFRMLNLDKQHAVTLFQLMDASGDGKVDINEFISGCAH